MLDDVLPSRDEAALVWRARQLMRIPGLYDVDQASLESGTVMSLDEDTAQQSFKNEVDINTIVRRFGISGELPVSSRRLAEYGDFSGVTDFHSAMNELRKGEERFNELPAKVRDRFENDPAKFWRFLHDEENAEKNLAEAVELGLIPITEVAAVASGEVKLSAPASGAPAPENGA